MEDEKEQLHKRIDRMQKKVWHSLNHGKTLRHLCKDLKCKDFIMTLCFVKTFLGWKCEELRKDVTSSSYFAGWKREGTHSCSAETGTEKPG